MSPTSPLPPPFAAGRTAELYPWQDGIALKLFFPGWSEGAARYEAEKGRIIYEAGLPAPAVHGVVEVDGRWGILYERIEGYPLIRDLLEKPEQVISIANLLADLHKEIHTRRAPGLPSQKEATAKSIREAGALPEEVRQALLERLESLPQSEAVCHGDFHPENIFIIARGPIILDWMDATRGYPLGDVARTDYLLSKAALPPHMPNQAQIQSLRERLTEAYLQRYFGGSPPDPHLWRDLQALVAAARLAEGIAEEQEQCVAIAKRWYEKKT